jgi:hypothetical protein
MKEYQLDCSKICCFIKIDDNGLIVEAAPIFRKFIGQELKNLTTWVTKKFSYCTLKELKNE